jgi:hypothetical protein
MMTSGKLKVFRSLGNFLSEFRLYRRDQDGKVVKDHDHLMDCLRYLVMSGRERMRTEPKASSPDPNSSRFYHGGVPRHDEWMM